MVCGIASLATKLNYGIVGSVGSWYPTGYSNGKLPQNLNAKMFHVLTAVYIYLYMMLTLLLQLQ